MAYIHMGTGMELLEYKHLTMKTQDNSLNQPCLQKIVSEESIDRESPLCFLRFFSLGLGEVVVTFFTQINTKKLVGAFPAV